MEQEVKLVPIDSVAPSWDIVVRGVPAVIGRGRDADIKIEDSWASRCHCAVLNVDGALVVRDLESSNGTYVNGARVVESPLLPHDTLTIGVSSFRVCYQLRTNGVSPGEPNRSGARLV